MKHGAVINLIGAALIGGAVILHIVCLATPYYSKLDVSSLYSKIRKMGAMAANMPGGPAQSNLNPDDMMQNDDSGANSGTGSSPNDMMQHDNSGPDVGSNPGTGSSPNDMVHLAKSESRGGSQSEMSMAMIEKIMQSVDVNIGIWKMCVSVKYQGMSMNACPKWGSKKFNPDLKTMDKVFQMDEVKGPGWIKAVQAMAIVGMLVMAAAAFMSVVNVVVPSQGDRLRLMPVIIFVCCFVGGIIVAIGAVIYASKQKSLLDDILPEGPGSEIVLSMIQDELSLSWGFSLDVVAAVTGLLAGVVHLVGNRANQTGGGIV